MLYAVKDLGTVHWTESLSLSLLPVTPEDEFVGDYEFSVIRNGKIVGWTTLGSPVADYIRMFNGANPISLEETRKEFLLTCM